MLDEDMQLTVGGLPLGTSSVNLATFLRKNLDANVTSAFVPPSSSEVALTGHIVAPKVWMLFLHSFAV